MIRLLVACVAFSIPAAALAASENVTLANSVYVERVESDGAAPKKVLEPPRTIAPGDTLVFVVSYRNRGADPASDVVVTNAVPSMVAYAGTDWSSAVVSVDGGRSWGSLSSLTIRTPDGQFRPAKPSDVTHVRWSFPRALGAGEAGQISFRGVVK